MASATTTGMAQRGIALRNVQRGPLAVEPHAIGAHWPRDILNLLLADEIEGAIEFALQMVERRSRHHHAARLGELFQPRGDIDAIAIDIAVHQRHIAQIDADAEHHALRFRQCGIARGQGLLDLLCAGNRINDAIKGDKRAVAHQLDDPAMVPGDGGIGQFGADGP